MAERFRMERNEHFVGRGQAVTVSTAE